MAWKSAYFKLKVLDTFFGGTVFTAPATLYLGLYTTAPTPGLAGTEVSGGSYARKSFANTSVNWNAASGGAKTNKLALNFARATASWGTIRGWGLYDAASGGNLLGSGSLTAPLPTVINGDIAQVAAGAIVLTET
jgi:hypothetical protein